MTMAFLDQNYLIDNESGREIYEKVKDLPILDAHNHGDVEEIVRNEVWQDIWQLEGATDHYVWEMMRRCGVPEEKITGAASNKEKWLALADVFPAVAANPVYEWIHLDLKRRFGIEENISRETAELIWKKTAELLKSDKMKPQNLLKEMKVEVMCTTDEPTSTLEYHQKAAEEISGVKILPTWRPDKGVNIEKEEWKDFVIEMGTRYSEDTAVFDGFLRSLERSHDFFSKNGCKASDHGLEEPITYEVAKERVAQIHEKAYRNEELSGEEIRDYKAHLLYQFGVMNSKTNWVTQLHIGAVRNYNDQLLQEIGPDSGGDISTQSIELVKNLKYFLNQFDGKLKIVLYSLDPTHWATLSTISRAFRTVYLGAAWWFNDSPYGMEEQLRLISSIDVLSKFAGMVTDSRKLISYGSRTEMFRRAMSSTLGRMVEKGQMPLDVAVKLAEGMAYRQPKELFF